ncbi:MAG: GntR family transcriptional regulator, partial [Betaproteobacteria bacterium]|nr:GntR family transcriptional regulator [Betaproteobacteria bacterium]
SELAYLSIKEKILSMELRPGSFLNEIKLCEMTSLGRMPVHQAIHRLQIEGLIEVLPRKGIVIRSDSLHDVLSLLEARLAMEPNVAALAAERISDEQIKQVKVLLKNSSLLLNQRQRESFSVIDREFHSYWLKLQATKYLPILKGPCMSGQELFGT